MTLTVEQRVKRQNAITAFNTIAGNGAFQDEMRGVEAAETRAAQATAELETLRAQIAEKDARIVALQKDLERERASTARQGVEAKAAALVASLGHKPLAMEPDDGDGGNDLIAQFEKEKDPEKRAALYERIMAARD